MRMRETARRLSPLYWGRKARKFAAIGALSLAVAGSTTWITHNTLQRRLDRKTTIDFVFGEHTGRNATNSIAPLLEEAKKFGNPYQFMVLESSDTEKNKRMQWEANSNWAASQMRSNELPFLDKLGKIISGTNISKFNRGIVIFNVDEIALAAKYGLIIKIGEAYPKSAIKRMSRELINSLVQIHKLHQFSKPGEVRTEIAANANRLQQYLDKRNAAIARVTANAANEIRKEFPDLKHRELRGIMHLGAWHSGTEKIIREKRPGLNVTRTLNANPNETNLISAAIEEIIYRGRRLNSKGNINKLAIASILEISFKNYLEHNMEKASELREKLLSLDENRATLIMSRVQEMQWLDGAIAIENAVLHTK